MNRRKFITSTIAVTASLGLGSTMFPAFSEPAFKKNKTALAVQQEWRELLPKDYSDSLVLTPFELSEQEWQQRLSSGAFKVLRDEKTERPGSSALNEMHSKGIYACEGCDLP